MTSPFRIFIDGRELDGWTTATLQRSKKELTGSLNVTIFFSYVPSQPVMRQATRGKDVQVYVGGHLAFFGRLDRRTGNGDAQKQPAGGTGSGVDISESVQIGPDSYTISLTARGQTKYLIDSSHDHPTTNILQPTDQDAVSQLIRSHNIPLEWLGEVVQLDKARFRDGTTIIEELRRVGRENAHYMYETRDGKLRVTDGPVGSGEPLILGENILTFSAEQSEEKARDRIRVKGHRTQKGVRGVDAVENREKEIIDEWANEYIPITVQHYGDATDEALERRGKFEADKRAQESKKVTIEVFHVQSRNGAPWDVGQLHYVQIPPEGIFEAMECTDVSYNVDAQGTLKTTLTLSPPPASAVAGGFNQSTGLDAIEGLSDAQHLARVATQRFGFEIIPGQFPDPWGSASLSIRDFEPIEEIVETAFDRINRSLPSLELPVGLNDDRT